MALIRIRRIGRTAAPAATGILLLVMAYATSYEFKAWMNGRGLISQQQSIKLDATVYAPILSGAQLEVPHCLWLLKLHEWCYWRGAGYDVRWNDYWASIPDSVDCVLLC